MVLFPNLKGSAMGSHGQVYYVDLNLVMTDVLDDNTTASESALPAVLVAVRDAVLASEHLSETRFL